MRMQLILKYACQFMTQQNQQQPWTHIQIMHVYVRTFNTSLAYSAHNCVLALPLQYIPMYTGWGHCLRFVTLAHWGGSDR